MNINVINNNIVLLFDNPIYSVIGLDSLKTLVVSTLQEYNPNPIITQLPEITAVMVPEMQLSVMMQNKSLIIGDQTISSFDSRHKLELITLAKKLQEVISRTILSYGYNYILNIENRNLRSLTTKLKAKYFKTRVFLPASASIIYTLPNLVFNLSRAKISIRFDTLIEGPNNQEADFLRANVNVHYNNDSSPFSDIDNIKRDYEAKYTTIFDFITSIFR